MTAAGTKSGDSGGVISPRRRPAAAATNNYDVILVSTLYCPNYPLVSRRENSSQKLDWTCTVQVKRWCNKCQEKYVLISTLYFVLSIEGLTLAYPSEDNFSSIN